MQRLRATAAWIRRPALGREHWLEAGAFVAVMAACAGVRVARLGSVPRIILGDEADNVQIAYHIVLGKGPGIYGFDWKPAPILSLYPLAWCIRIFGDSVADFRMFPVITSLLVITLFYIVARKSMGAAAALLAMALLGTNLWFLHFSRTAWENGNAALFALGACWATTRAIEDRRWWWCWWLLSGVFVTLGLYGYFSGRFIFVSVGLMAGLAIALRLAPWKQTLAGLGIAALVAGSLFAPMAKHIYEEWDYFNRRTNNVSVFHTTEPYEGDTNGWVIAAKNVKRNAFGLILQSGDETSRGLWSRYNPQGRAPLDAIATVLFLAGLAVAAWRWRKTYGWFTFFAPLFIAEVFSRGSPDLARAVIFAPFYFLFIGLAFDEMFKAVRKPAPRVVLGVAALAVVSWVAVTNVRDYFEWQGDEAAQMARVPGVDVCEWDLWRGMAKESAAAGHSVLNPEQFDEQRRKLNCSSITRLLPISTPTRVVLPTPTPIASQGGGR